MRRRFAAENARRGGNLFVCCFAFVFGIWAELDGKAVRHAGMPPINRRNVEAFRSDAVAAVFVTRRFRAAVAVRHADSAVILLDRKRAVFAPCNVVSRKQRAEPLACQLARWNYAPSPCVRSSAYLFITAISMMIVNSTGSGGSPNESRKEQPL